MMFSHTRNQLKWMKIQYDKPLNSAFAMFKSDTFAPADSLKGTAAFVLPGDIPGDQILPSLLPMACYPAWSYSF